MTRSAQHHVVRALGWTLIVLGFGSSYLRTQLDVDTVLTVWMGSAQPASGVAMGVVGLGVMAFAHRVRPLGTS